jgi:hypothetical protein
MRATIPVSLSATGGLRPRTSILIAIAAVIAVNVALLLLLGVRLGGDAPRYIDGARRIAEGEPLTDRQQVYFGYIYLLAVLDRLGLGLWPMYAVQFAGTTAAAAAAVHLGRQFGGAFVPLLTGLAWAFFFHIQKWNVYLLTDALFISSVMVATALVVRARHTGLVPALLAVLAMATLRLNGVAFAAVFLGYLLVVRQRRGARAGIAAAALLVVLMPSAAPLTSLHPAPPEGTAAVQTGTLSFLTEGHVIWDTVMIPMPSQGPSSGRLIPDLLGYVFAHPVAVLKLYALRLLHYLFAYNPYFSFRNIVVTTTLWIMVYGWTLAGLRIVTRRYGPGAAWLVILWLCQAALVVLTVGDYDGRYSLYAVPALLPFVAVGLNEALSWIWRHPRLKAAA